jgi:hypothetical protein
MMNAKCKSGVRLAPDFYIWRSSFYILHSFNSVLSKPPANPTNSVAAHAHGPFFFSDYFVLKIPHPSSYPEI